MAEETEEATEGGKGLRAQLEAALAANKAMSEQLSEFKTKSHQLEVKSVLEARGVNPKIAKFIGDDVTDVDAWLTENQDVFGFTVGQGTGEPNVSPDVVQQTQRLQNLTQSSVPAGKVEDLQARMANAKNDAELNDLWAEARSFLL